MWDKFSNYLNMLIEKYVPHKRLNCNKLHTPKHIKKLYDKKRILHRRFKTTGKGKHAYTECCRFYRNAVIQQSVQDENEAVYSNNQKRFFKYINLKMRTQPSIPPLRKENGELEILDIDKAEILNNFFTSVFTKDDNVNPPFPNRTLNASINTINISPAFKQVKGMPEA
jgi:hypothetical protein